MLNVQAQKEVERRNPEIQDPLAAASFPRRKAQAAPVEEAGASKADEAVDISKVQDLLWNKGRAITTLQNAEKRIEKWLEGDSFLKFRSHHPVGSKGALDGLKLGLLCGGAFEISTIVGQMINPASRTYSSEYLIIGAAIFSLCLLGGLAKAGWTAGGNYLRSRRRDESYYEREIMLRACNPALDKEQQRELIKASLQALQEQRQGIEQEIEEIKNTNAAALAKQKQSEFDKVLAGIKEQLWMGPFYKAG